MSEDLFGRRPMRTVAREVLESLGGRAGRDDLIEGVRHKLTVAEYDVWSAAAFRRDVLASVKSRASQQGESAVYGIGDEVAALTLFSVEEFRAKAVHAASLSKANHALVYRLAELCLSVHGTTFDADDVIGRSA